jgi:uncharacterized lipoprotein YehR (DUF1307 family)
MTPEEYKKLLEKQKAKFKKITGVASDKEVAMLKDSIPKPEIDAKFITERTGAAVSEEELEMLKKLMPR